MSVVVLTSFSGAPGVSTAALGLLLHWPGSCLLVDADAQQTFLAGHLRGGFHTTSSLTNVINAARITEDVRWAVWNQTVPLPGEDRADGDRRLLLPGLTNPSQTPTLRQTWGVVGRALRILEEEAHVDVVVDVGRVGAGGLHQELLAVADRVLVLTRPTLRSVAAARWGASRLAEQAGAMPTGPQMGLVVVRQPRLRRAGYPVEHHYPDRVVAQTLGLPVVGRLPFDPATASVLSEGGDRGDRYRRSGYAAAVTRLASTLAVAGRDPVAALTDDDEVPAGPEPAPAGSGPETSTAAAPPWWQKAGTR